MKNNNKIMVAGIIASGNRNGSTATLVREALKGAGSAGAETEEIFMHDYKIGFCKGCDACLKIGYCILKDNFQSVYQKLKDADCLILSSPTYGALPSAIIKNLFDRLGRFEFLTSSVFGGKYIVSISTTKIFGADKVIKYLTGVATKTIFKRGFESGSLAVKMKEKKNIAEISGILSKARELGKKIVTDRMSGKKFALQNINNRIIIRFILKPLLLKNIAKNKDKFFGVFNNLKMRGFI